MEVVGCGKEGGGLLIRGRGSEIFGHLLGRESELFH